MLILALALALIASTAIGTAAAVAKLEVSTKPALYPDFKPAVHNYVTRCKDRPVRVKVATGGRGPVRIDRGHKRNGHFSKGVALEPGEAFRLRAGRHRARVNYRIRCLPRDFPDWTWERESGSPFGSQWLLTAIGDYVVIFDRFGTPAWWYGVVANDAHVLSDGTLAWATLAEDAPPGYAIRGINGKLKRRVHTVGTPADFHDFQMLPNGNYLLDTYKRREGVDLTAYGGPADGAVTDAEVQEIAPDGSLVWSWNSKDHIGLEETGRWWEMIEPDPGEDEWDIIHLNSAEVDGDRLLISSRHTDAIYSIDRASGEIVWKLGGTTTPESLTVLGNDHGGYPIAGQHDARLLSDGTLTAFDNGHERPRPPRAVHYEIDEQAGTAKLIGMLNDPEITDTFCCGDYRQTDDGGALVTWGGSSPTPAATGFAPNGKVRYRLSIPELRALYRVVPVPGGVFKGRGLRRAMDAMHPHDAAVTARG